MECYYYSSVDYKQFISKMYNNPLYSDTKISLQSGEILHAHKFILCNMSNMLRVMFLTDSFIESSSPIKFAHSDAIVCDTLKLLYSVSFKLNKPHKVLKFLHFLQADEELIKGVVLYVHMPLSKRMELATLYKDQTNVVPCLLRVLFDNLKRATSIKINYDTYVYILEYINKSNCSFGVIFKNKLRFIILYCEYTNDTTHLEEFLLSLDHNNWNVKHQLCRIKNNKYNNKYNSKYNTILNNACEKFQKMNS